MADASSIVATNSLCSARLDSPVPIAVVDDDTSPPTPSITTPVTPADLPAVQSHSEPAHTPVIAQSESVDQSSIVASNSLVIAHLDSSAPLPLVSTRPSTRSTSTPIHPFFINLNSRTGKAAKHFRRLYKPTSEVCECGLFPRYNDQVRSAESPSIALSGPLRTLCLECIWLLVEQHEGEREAADKDGKQPRWHAHHVPGLIAPTDGLLWNNSMIDTYNTHYKAYYTHADKCRTPNLRFRQN